jgi:hypothetical protein
MAEKLETCGCEILLGKTAGETAVRLETAYEEAALGKTSLRVGFPLREW